MRITMSSSNTKIKQKIITRSKYGSDMNDNGGRDDDGGGGGGDDKENFKIITPVQAKIILNNWWQVTASMPHNNDSADLMYKSISELKNYLNNHFDSLDVYMVWCPSVNHNRYINSYYIVACKIDPYEKKLKINRIVQNPIYHYIEPIEIPSIRFKYEIMEIANRADVIADFSNLFDYDPRYKLSWLNNLN